MRKVAVILLVAMAAAGMLRYQAGREVQTYLRQAQHAQDRARQAGMSLLDGEASYRESAALAQLALERGRSAGFSAGEVRALEELVAVYAGQREYAAVAALMRQGPLQKTGSPYDLAIQGTGFFRLVSPQGEVVYTRSGGLHYDRASGELVDAEGCRTGLVVPKDVTNLEINAEGVCQGTPMSGDGRPEVLGQLHLVRFPCPNHLERLRGLYYRAGEACGEPVCDRPGANGLGVLCQGHLETNWQAHLPPTEGPGLLGTLRLAQIAAAADAAGLEPELVQAVVEVESQGDPRKMSWCGALGLMQLMPETCQEMGVTDPLDPEQNLRGGTRYLRDLRTRFQGDTRLAVAAFNAGPQAVEKAGGIPDFQETRDYTRSVMERFAELERGRPRRTGSRAEK